MTRAVPTLLVAAAIAAFAAATRAAPAETDLLLRSLFRHRVAAQTAAQAGELGTAAGDAAAEQVAAAADRWSGEIHRSIRSELAAAFGENAKDRFGEFVETFTSAERENDPVFLAALARDLRWTPPPADYGALRRMVLEQLLARDLSEAARFLGEVQTWLDLRRRSAEVPPLQAWLERAQPVPLAPVEDSPPPRLVPQRPRSSNPLRDAEAPAGEYTPSEEPAAGGLDAFSGARTARREKALEVAQAGMAQIAEERRAAEEELAARKTSAAQAEAEAVKKHAEKLAAAEQDAIEQRKNSWSGRLKQIVSTTIGAAGGAFLGGVGSRAGEAAAEAVFKK